MSEKRIQVDELSMITIQTIFGDNDVHLHEIENEFSVSIHFRNNEFIITGETDQSAMAMIALQAIINLVKVKSEITKNDVLYACSLAKENKTDQLTELYSDVLAKTYVGKPVYPKTLGQRSYVETLKNNDIVFGVGPAGTGKTYLAVVYAASLLKKNAVKRIVLTRPAVEAGESLGFLPGDLKEKVDPYLRPLYDALYDMLGEENTTKMIEKGIIEIAPLAYMRGRTLNDAFVILDEAQNTTRAQMKMFLTRLGFQSKMVITGDMTQIDLPSTKQSGLLQAVELLKNINGIGISRLSADDVVRHPLVGKIIHCYEAFDEGQKNK